MPETAFTSSPIDPSDDDAAWLHRTFADALRWASETHGQREAIVHERDGLVARFTYAQLHARVRAFARGLIGLGVEHGEHVALWMSDSDAWMVARWAVPMIGAVLIPINTRFRDADIRDVLVRSDATTLILDEAAPGGTRYIDILARIEPSYERQSRDGWAGSALPALRRVICRSAASSSSMHRFDAIEARGGLHVDDGQLDARIAAARPDDVAQILYTSGTTSFPKGAMVCHGPLLQNNHATVDRMHLTAADRYLSCVPLFSATGTSYTLSMLLAGAAIVIADRFEPRLFCELVERERITVGFFVDTIVQDLRAFDARRDYDLSSLRTGTGAPLSYDAFMFVTEVLQVPELIGVFGMSETSNAVARGDCSDPLAKRATTNGRPVPGVQIRIADPETNTTLPRATMGEICVRGFNLMRGYYKQPDEDAKAFDAEGWLHSGDLGELDADGFLIYRGRVKEMIKPGGFNVATQEIEVFLKTHPAVREAVVVGVPDARMGEVPCAFVEARPGTPIDADALIAYSHEHIANYKVPRHVFFVTEWPTTGSAKIRKAELKDRAASLLGPQAIDVDTLAALREGGTAVALLDVRDPVEAERGHIDGATVLPRRRIESGIGALVRDRGTAIVTLDDDGGRARLAAATLARLGYRDVRWLAGGVRAWEASGRSSSTGANVPSKRFGEAIHHDAQVPAIDGATLRAWQAEGRDVLVCDVRTPGEYEAATIPGSSSTPSFDIALHAAELARHDAVVVHCAGRTRSIIGTQTLRELGLSNVVALENGTMGWRLAGQPLERGAARKLTDEASLDAALLARSRALADAAGVQRIDARALAALLAFEGDRYVFDVRGITAHEAGHVDGSRPVPGGQVVQRTDDFIAVRVAPVALIDEGDLRADLTGLWLKRMGLPSVAVLDGGIDAWRDAGHGLVTGRERPTPLGWREAVAAARMLNVDDAQALLERDPATLVVDVDLSTHHDAGHVPGAQWLPRGWLEARIAALAPSTGASILVTCADGRQAPYAAVALQAMGYRQVHALEGGARAWRARGLPLEGASLPPQDDVSLPPYLRGIDAMRDYLDWETRLVPDPASAPGDSA